MTFHDGPGSNMRGEDGAHRLGAALVIACAFTMMASTTLAEGVAAPGISTTTVKNGAVRIHFAGESTALEVTDEAPTDSARAVVTSSDILRIRFTVDNNFTPEAPNTMELLFGIVNVIEPFTSRIAELYDGNTLLSIADQNSFGNHVGPLSLNPSNSWAAVGSPFTFDGAAQNVDFTTILDGTIDGRIDWHPQTGSVDIPLDQINLAFISATSCCGGLVVNPPPTITSIEIIGACAADLDGSGAVDFGDILAILGTWGNAGGPEDLDGSGFVDFGDLLVVLGDWGPCP